MYIPPVPLFNFRSLLNYPFQINKLSFHTWLCEGDKKIAFFPRGCYALSYIAKCILKKKKSLICFLPSYFCNNSLIPLRNEGAKIIFYAITEDFTPDWANVRMLSEIETPDMFVLVHYFGNIIDNTEALHFAKDTGCIIVEDGAHVFTPQNKMGKGGSISIFSLHKLLPMPPIAIASIPDSIYTDLKNFPIIEKWSKSDYIWFLKRILQKAAIFSRLAHVVSYNKHKQHKFAISEELIISSQSVADEPLISPLGKLLIRLYEKKIYHYSIKQKSNADYFSKCLSVFLNNDYFKIYNKFNNDTIPYKFPLFVDQNQISGLYDYLSNKGILVETWPDLPPEIIRQKDLFKEAIDYRNSILFFPIHASITLKYLSFAVDLINQYLTNAEKYEK